MSLLLDGFVMAQKCESYFSFDLSNLNDLLTKQEIAIISLCLVLVLKYVLKLSETKVNSGAGACSSST